MKLKTLLLALLLVCGSSIFAQVTIDVFINGTKAGQYTIKKDATTGGISYKKKDYKNLDKLSIQISGKLKEKGNVRTVEVSDNDDVVIYTAPETEGIKNQFILSDKAVIKRLSKGKSVKLNLVSAPANEKMAGAIRKTYIGTLSTGK